MKRSMLIFALAAAYANCAVAKTVGEEINDLKTVIASNSVDATTRCRYYRAWYIDQCTKEEREAILDRNVAAHRRWMELAPKDVKPHADLGKVLTIGGRRDEAIKEFTIALAKANQLNFTTKVGAKWWLAECLWRKGDKTGAQNLIAEIANEKNPPEYPPLVYHKAKYLHRAWTDPDGDIDAFKLPHSQDGKPYPTPQEEKYGDAKVPLASVEVCFGTKGTNGTKGSSFAKATEDKTNDPIVRLLRRKLTRFGAKFENGGTKIAVEISPDAPVDKPQGYSLDVKDGRIRIAARTRHGALWGVVSFIQCVDRGALAIRECTIRDWPVCLRRGVINYWYPDYLEYAIFNKMSSVQMRIMGKPEWTILFSSLERERAKLWVKRFNDFCVSYYWADRNLTVSPVLPLSSPRTRAMHLAWFRCAATIGANICFDMDDERFYPIPLHPLDVKAAGSATNLDAKYLTGIYREVKAEFPEFKMTFGTPFYFGPAGPTDKTWYPEDRKEYLKSLGEFLDPEIDVYWSGPRVKSYGFSPKNMTWMSDLIKRKQVVFHNSDCAGRHNHVSYGADIPNYKGSHCSETFDYIGGFYQNSSRYEEACAVGPAMDWCWNPNAHDAATATRREIEMLEGPGVFEIIRAATPTLAYFDKYAYGTPRSELFMENPDDLDRRIAECEKAWNEAKALGKNGGRFVSGFRQPGLVWAKRLADYRRKPPKWLIEKRDAEMANTKFAVEDVGYDESKGDIFFPAELLSGGYYHHTYDYSNRGTRGIKYLDVGKELVANFPCEPFPPEVTPRLFICGEAFRKEKPILEVEVNGQHVWKDEVFIEHYFKPIEIEIPVHVLNRSANRLVIRNVSPKNEPDRKPLIHYVVIKK